jgi:uncharacterized protein YuzE
MKIEYDKKADAVYIYLQEKGAIPALVRTPP